MRVRKRRLIPVFVAVILIVVCIAPTLCSAGPAGAAVQVPDPGAGQALVGWESRDIDGTGEYGYSFSLAVDTHGTPHIASTESRSEFSSSLVYFTRDLGGWKKEVVDDQSAVLSTPQITTDPFGQPHIIYGYLINGVTADYALKYAHKDRFGWHIENLTDTIGQTYGDASIAVNIQGAPRIVYSSFPEGSLMYASKDGNTWHTEQIDPDDSSWPILQLDRNGEPRVLYTYLPTYYSREKRYASRNQGEWGIEVIDQNYSGRFSGFVLDLLGTPHIAFYRVIPGNYYEEVVYFTRGRAGWQQDTVASGNLRDYATVVASGNGIVGVSYAVQDAEDQVTSILYAIRTRSGWNRETVSVKGDSFLLQPGFSMAGGPGGAVSLTATRTNTAGYPQQVTPFLATRGTRTPVAG